MQNTTTVNGLITRINEKPFDLSAVSSLFSDMLPKVISEERSMANGSAKGIKLAET